MLICSLDCIITIQAHHVCLVTSILIPALQPNAPFLCRGQYHTHRHSQLWPTCIHSRASHSSGNNAKVRSSPLSCIHSHKLNSQSPPFSFPLQLFTVVYICGSGVRDSHMIGKHFTLSCISSPLEKLVHMTLDMIFKLTCQFSHIHTHPAMLLHSH